MDGNGFTGFNPGQAKENIRNFAEYADNVDYFLKQAFEYLFSELYWKWCSPKAVEFDGKYNELSSSICGEFRTMTDNIATSAKEAYNVIARAHHEATIEFNTISDLYIGFGNPARNDVSQHSTGYGARGQLSLQHLVASHPTSNAVGMNVSLVKVIVQEFETKITNVIERIGSIPTNIAYFDEDGSQQESYRNTINSMKEKITGLVDSIKTDIKSASEEEENSVMLAKEQATQVLNG